MNDYPQVKVLRESLAAVNLALPETRQAYADLIKSFEPATMGEEAVHKLILNTADIANAYYNQLESERWEGEEIAPFEMDWMDAWRLKTKLTLQEATSLAFEIEPANSRQKPNGLDGFYSALSDAIKSDFDTYHDAEQEIRQLDDSLRGVIASIRIESRAAVGESENLDITTVLNNMAALTVDIGEEISCLAKKSTETAKKVKQSVAILTGQTFNPDSVAGYEFGMNQDECLEYITVQVPAIKKWLLTTEMKPIFFFPELATKRMATNIYERGNDIIRQAVAEVKALNRPPLPRLPEWEAIKEKEKEGSPPLVSDLFVNAKNSAQCNDVSECVKSFIEKNKKQPSGHVELFAHMKTLHEVKNQAVMLPSGAMDKENLRRNYERWTTPSDQK